MKNRLLFVLLIVVLIFGSGSTIYVPLVGTEEAAVTTAVAPYADAPECAQHDERVWHSLWNEQQGCYYDHLHGDSPHLVDDIFGTDYYTVAGGEISYPWQTDGENHMNHKHEGYVWFARRDLPCENPYADGCIRAFRAQTHADLHNVVSEHHSYSIEALVCPDKTSLDCGIVRFGGWQHVGDLHIDRTQVINRAEPPRAPRPTQNHGWQIGNFNFATWYSISPSAIIRITPSIGDMWGYYAIPSNVPVPASEMGVDKMIFQCPVDPATGAVPAGCRKNGSYLQPHLIGVGVPVRHRSTLDPDADGVIDYQGYVDRYGAFVNGCSTTGLDCIPVYFENVRIPADGAWQFRGDYREYDITPEGASWIRFPQ